MATELFVKSTATALIPADENSIVEFKGIAIGNVYKCVLSIPRAVNSDNATDEQRTVAANRLYWAWLTDCQNTTVNEYAGHSQDWWHVMFKKKFLMRIYERDSQEYAELLQSVRKVKAAGLEDEAQRIYDHVATETSTTRATVSQFREYLNRIERTCQELGIWLRTDQWLYSLAVAEGRA